MSWLKGIIRNLLIGFFLKFNKLNKGNENIPHIQVSFLKGILSVYYTKYLLLLALTLYDI